MIRSQIETWSGVSAKWAGRGDVPCCDRADSVLRAWANSEGGRKARNEIQIVYVSLNPKPYLCPF